MTTTLWTANGNIAVRSGKVLTCASCPCTGIDVSCGDCTLMPSKWTLTLQNAGTIANNGCSGCVTGLGGGGPWTLYYIPSGNLTCSSALSAGCFWGYPDGVNVSCLPGIDVCQPGDNWLLSFASSVWTLELNGPSPANILTFNSITSLDFKCLGTNIFTVNFWNSSTCTDSGLTATIVPA